MYLDKIRVITESKFVPFVPDTLKITPELVAVKGTITPPVDVNAESKSTPEKINKGKTIFETNCISCHGTEGKGDGAAGKTLNPPPRNFTVLTGWKNGNKISQMFKTLSEGIPGSSMAQFVNLSPEERFSVIHYVRTFNNDFPKDSPEDLKALDIQYSLSAGIKQPNQIPVSSAIKILVNENSAKNEKLKILVEKIKNDKTEKGAEIFRNITLDMNRALLSLLSFGKWNENETQFVNFIGVNPIQKGFSSKAITLQKEEVSVVFRYLQKLFIQ
jgi:mono/diheme cytochrome c family protein